MKQLTLGKLINKLEALPPEDEIRLAKDATQLSLTWDSYRGYYEDIAFGHEQLPTKEKVTVGDFLHLCKESVNSMMEGWKGGVFWTKYETLCWLSNEGIVSGDKIVDVKKYNGKVFLITIYDHMKAEEDYG